MGWVSIAIVLLVRLAVVGVDHADLGWYSACMQLNLYPPDSWRWHDRYPHHRDGNRWSATTPVSDRRHSACADDSRHSVVYRLWARQTIIRETCALRLYRIHIDTHIGCGTSDDFRRDQSWNSFFETSIFKWDDNFWRFHLLHVFLAWRWRLDLEWSELLGRDERSCIDRRCRSNGQFAWCFVFAYWIRSANRVGALIIRTGGKNLQSEHFAGDVIFGSESIAFRKWLSVLEPFELKDKTPIGEHVFVTVYESKITPGSLIIGSAIHYTFEKPGVHMKACFLCFAWCIALDARRGIDRMLYDDGLFSDTFAFESSSNLIKLGEHVSVLPWPLALQHQW